MWEILNINSRFCNSNVHIHIKELTSIGVWVDGAGFIFPLQHVVHVGSAGLGKMFLYADKIIEPGVTAGTRLAHVLSNCSMIFESPSSATWTARHQNGLCAAISVSSLELTES